MGATLILGKNFLRADQGNRKRNRFFKHNRQKNIDYDYEYDYEHEHEKTLISSRKVCL